MVRTGREKGRKGKGRKGKEIDESSLVLGSYTRLSPHTHVPSYNLNSTGVYSNLTLRAWSDEPDYRLPI